MLRFINNKLDHLFFDDDNQLNKVRAQFLVNTLLSSLLVILVTLPSFYNGNNSLLLFIRSIFIAFFQIFLVWLTLTTKKWKIVAHSLCTLLIVLIASNIFIHLQGIKIISLQWMLLIIIMSYYLLGTKWGIFYSSISLTFMLFYFMIYGSDALTSVTNQTNNFAFVTVFSFNFLLIIYVQYHFFRAYNLTIQQLKEKQVAEKLLNEKLKEAVVFAEKSAKAKSYFLSTISHELRTPLNGVIGMTDVLLLDNPRDDQEENLNLLKFSANNLLTLINDVLDINKIESGNITMEKTPFKIYQLVKNISAGFNLKANEKKIDLIIEIDKQLIDTVIIGDPTRLTQILINLIDNALKFTEEGTVSISLKAIDSSEEDITIQFCISDSGIGIPKDQQEFVFESFSQASSSITRKYGGTGLGLAIVKNLLDLHNSKITTISQEGIGTTFKFDINYKLHNFAVDSNNFTPTQTNSIMDISKLSILVAEDNQMNTLLMKKLLAKWDITPDFANNGAEAVTAFNSKAYDLILMDIHMPVMDGYEATAEIRKHTDQQKANVPIIALTASVALDAREKISNAGINDFVSKPFNPDELRGKLEEIANNL
jgi:signal transduction histidine kinase/ActR/RegA family two-component response regulator